MSKGKTRLTAGMPKFMRKWPFWAMLCVAFVLSCVIIASADTPSIADDAPAVIEEHEPTPDDEDTPEDKAEDTPEDNGNSNATEDPATDKPTVQPTEQSSPANNYTDQNTTPNASSSSPADTNATESTPLPLKAICKDGTISYQDDPYGSNYKGMCSGHGGIAQKLGRVR